MKRKWNAAWVGEGVGRQSEVRAARKPTQKQHASALSSAETASNELVAFDIREASESLALITGEVTSEEILNHIFSRFCIGK